MERWLVEIPFGHWNSIVTNPSEHFPVFFFKHLDGPTPGNFPSIISYPARGEPRMLGSLADC